MDMHPPTGQPGHPNSERAVAGQKAAASEFLTFRLGAEEYGIDILRVQEIRSYEEDGAPRPLARNDAAFCTY